MINFLEFKPAKCRDCYKCLRHCPVKAIEVVNHQAQIIRDRCVLCGTCTDVCPQNAKKVHSSIDDVKALLSSDEEIIASVAPSFVSSFNVDDFSIFKLALLRLGFSDAEETSVGAKAVTNEYKKMLDSAKYKNLISSSCPAVNRTIQLYYPEALKYLAPCDTPMIAHAKIILRNHPKAKIVFIGPCIAKKREAYESGIISSVLTYEELSEMLKENEINILNIASINQENSSSTINKAKYYPISRGIIKSFSDYNNKYEYVAVDGLNKVKDVLSNIEDINGMFIELNSCEYACINGPCSILKKGTAVTANSLVREYANKDIIKGGASKFNIPNDIDFSFTYERIRPHERVPSEREITDILARTGKTKKEDELNCGACGYETCREKAWAVANGFADIEMCVPYMRTRAESMSFEIIQNMPNGIVVLNDEYKISDINKKAISLLGMGGGLAKGENLYDYMDISSFIEASQTGKNFHKKIVSIDRTSKIIELTIISLKKDNILFGVLKDITNKVNYDKKLQEVKLETLSTTDEVIKKQMRVAQEIASVLGETVAETKVALLNLKKTLQEGSNKEDE